MGILGGSRDPPFWLGTNPGLAHRSTRAETTQLFVYSGLSHQFPPKCMIEPDRLGRHAFAPPPQVTGGASLTIDKPHYQGFVVAIVLRNGLPWFALVCSLPAAFGCLCFPIVSLTGHIANEQRAARRK